MKIQDERERLEQHIQRELDEENRRTLQVAPPPPTEPAVLIEDSEEFLINSIVLEGDDAPSHGKRVVLARYEGSRMRSSQMVDLIRELTNAYAADGYVTTTVTLQPQNIREGKLVLRVQWGRVKAWRIHGNLSRWRERSLLAMLPERRNAKLNIRDIDQAVEVLNNGSLAAKVDIVAAEALGESYIDVTVRDAPGMGMTVSADNSGVGDDNEGRYRGSVNWLLGGIGADVWNLGGTHRHFGDGSGDVEESLSFSGTVPFGYWELEARHGISRYEKAIRTPLGSYYSDGNSADQSITVSRVLSRSGDGKTTGTLRVSHRDSNNYINGLWLEVNSKRYTDVVAGLSHVDRLLGGALYADVNWGQGTRWLGANDLRKPGEGKTPALYHKMSGNVSWNRAWQPFERRLDYSFRVGWQYASHPMLTANKLSLGDEYTVRGFKGESVYGDSGLYVSNTLQTPVVPGVSIFVGIDAGGVQDALPGARRQYLSGWSIGVRGQWRNAGVSVTSATPIRAESWMTGGSVLYLNTNVRF